MKLFPNNLFETISIHTGYYNIYLPSKNPPTSVLDMTLNNQSDSQVPVMLELWGMWSTPSLPSFPDPLWSGVVAPDTVLSIGQIELNCVG